MRLQHTGLPVEDHWVEKLRDLYLVPSFAEYNITPEYFVFESSSEAPFRRPLFDMLLYLPSDPTDCADLSPAEFSNLELAVEHPLDEGRVLVDLERLTDQLQLLHHFEVRVELYHNTSHANPEMGDVLTQVILKFLNSNEGGAQGIGRAIEGGIAETEFWGVFNHP